MRNVRVFGSVSRGEDTAQSDVDLLVDLDDNVSLLDLARLESAISKLVGAKVDVVSAAGLRANLRDKVLTEAVPL
ncbi:MAG: nucleotidyltransferase domain-containing protein [Pseudolysinimonas sp.]